MAIAVTPFEVLCGFRPYEEISNFLEKIPEFYGIVGETIAQKVKKKTFDCFYF